VRLNLGSGMSGIAAVDVLGIGRDGWKSIDICPAYGADESYDVTEGIRELDDSVALIWMGDFLEHVPRAKCVPLLRECRRVLKMGAQLRISVPDMTKVMLRWLVDDDGESDELSWLVYGQQGETQEGRNAGPDSHLNGFTESRLRAALRHAGFITATRVTYHGVWFELGMLTEKAAG